MLLTDERSWARLLCVANLFAQEGTEDGRAGGDPDAGSDSHLDGADLPVSVPDGPGGPGGGNAGGVRGLVVHLSRRGGSAALRRHLGTGVRRFAAGDGPGD